MDLGWPGRDQATRIWLKDQAKRLRRGKIWERWYPATILIDVYWRGYNHGYADRAQEERA
jgi:hypothetical protein